MPTPVRRHLSHSRSGRPEVVRRYIRNGPEHSVKWKKLVAQIKAEGSADNPEAVATSILGQRSFLKRSRHA
jgi:hypothetical protein